MRLSSAGENIRSNKRTLLSTLPMLALLTHKIYPFFFLIFAFQGDIYLVEQVFLETSPNNL